MTQGCLFIFKIFACACADIIVYSMLLISLYCIILCIIVIMSYFTPAGAEF